MLAPLNVNITVSEHIQIYYNDNYDIFDDDIFRSDMQYTNKFIEKLCERYHKT